MLLLQTFWNEETGVVVSAELVLIMTVAVLAMVVGLSEVAIAVNTELNDISNAIGALDQSYFYAGFRSVDGHKTKSYYVGSRFYDNTDSCDHNRSCDLVCNVNCAGGECHAD